MSSKIFGDLSLHPFFENLGLSAGIAAIILPPIEGKLLDPSTMTPDYIEFGTGVGDYAATPRGFQVLAEGAVNFRIGRDGDDSTQTYTAGTIETGFIGRITKSGSTSTSIKLLY